jgi:hypothetical protein
MTEWLETLRSHASQKGQNAVATELGLSKATISLVLRGKYGAATDAIRAKVERAYIQGGTVNCPVAGPMPFQTCTEFYRRSKAGLSGGNPVVLRILRACRECPERV